MLSTVEARYGLPISELEYLAANGENIFDVEDAEREAGAARVELGGISPDELRDLRQVALGRAVYLATVRGAGDGDA